MDDFEIVGEAGDGLEAIELAEQLKPDVILNGYNDAQIRWIRSHQAH